MNENYEKQTKLSLPKQDTKMIFKREKNAIQFNYISNWKFVSYLKTILV